MTEIQDIENNLGGLTEWDGDETSLWKTALEKTPRTARTKVNPVIAKITSWGFLRVAAAVIVVMTITVAMLPEIGRARNSVVSADYSNPERSFQLSREAIEKINANALSLPALPASSETHFAINFDAPARANLSRSIIRKAMIELRTTDVRATFFLIPGILNASIGEYIQESSIRGEGERASAEVILRVGAGRLEEAMDELRNLGEVTGEQIRGEDVTNQIVDLDARLRNAGRVEQEMLHLLESRDDAPLKEILDLQEAIGRVRLNIEQMTAQRDNLNALAKLATVRVSIRAAKTEEQADDHESLGAYFVDQIGGAWQSGMTTLVNAVAFVVRGFIGGLLWWSILLIAIAIVYRTMARRSANDDAAFRTASSQSSSPSSNP